MAKETILRYGWNLKMRTRSRDAWVYLSDTSKLYRAAFMPKRTFREENGKLVVGQTLFFLLKEEWIEQPWEWVFGKTIAIHRDYAYGMAKALHVRFEVEEKSDDECVVTMNFDWRLANLFWFVAIWLTVPAQKIVTRYLFKKIERHLASARAEFKYEALSQENQYVSATGLTRMKKIKQDLLDKKLSAAAIDNVCDWITKTDDMDAYRLQVKPLARKWNVPQRDLLNVCLHASRMGLLSISWDVICPHCRGVRFEATSLGSIPTGGDCEVCEVDFKTDRLDAIEVSFHIHPSIRQVEEVKFCAAEASKKTHIKVQYNVPAGAEVLLNPVLDEGHHRLRLKGKKATRLVLVSSESKRCEIGWSGEHDEERGEVVCGPKPALRFRNQETEPVILVLEEQRWRNVALLPAEVLLVPEFQDLFSEEHLHVDVKLSLGHHTILFTDIVGSTKFYQEVGDGKAFRDVKNHFNEVFAVVERNGGCVVKTIGDSVMAAFHTSHEGVRSAIEIQELFNESRSDTPIRLRISVHSGSVIAVHIRKGVDFFGGTVNVAAKLQGCAEAHEIALSKDVYDQSHSVMRAEHPVEKRSLKARYTDSSLDAHVIRVVDSRATSRSA